MEYWQNCNVAQQVMEQDVQLFAMNNSWRGMALKIKLLKLWPWSWQLMCLKCSIIINNLWDTRWLKWLLRKCMRKVEWNHHKLALLSCMTASVLINWSPMKVFSFVGKERLANLSTRETIHTEAELSSIHQEVWQVKAIHLEQPD